MKPLDDQNGWCCTGITYEEHVKLEGRCCQEPHTPINKLPWYGQLLAVPRWFWHKVLD